VRSGWSDEPEGPVAFLRAVAENPEQAMADIAFDAAALQEPLRSGVEWDFLPAFFIVRDIS